MKYSMIYDRWRMDVKAICVFSSTEERAKRGFEVLMQYAKEQGYMDNLAELMSLKIEPITAKEAHKYERFNTPSIDCSIDNFVDQSKLIYRLWSNRSEKLLAISNSLHIIINKIEDYKRPDVFIDVVENEHVYSLANITTNYITVFFKGLEKTGLKEIDFCKRVMPFKTFITMLQHKDSTTYDMCHW